MMVETRQVRRARERAEAKGRRLQAPAPKVETEYVTGYPNYDGPDKPDKGQEGGSCNRSLCQASPALWYNHGSYAWYCARCRRDIEFDSFNKRDWDENWLPRVGHPMFETREMMDARKEQIDG